MIPRAYVQCHETGDGTVTRSILQFATKALDTTFCRRHNLYVSSGEDKSLPITGIE